jgi:hypothetical protein
MKSSRHHLLAVLALAACWFFGVSAPAKDIKLLNVSYDPTRELYQDFNGAFAKHWKQKTGDTVVIQQSHAGRRGVRVGSAFTIASRWAVTPPVVQANTAAETNAGRVVLTAWATGGCVPCWWRQCGAF